MNDSWRHINRNQEDMKYFHLGEELTGGCKYILRSDIMFLRTKPYEDE